MSTNIESVKEEKLRAVLELTTDILAYPFWSFPLILLNILKRIVIFKPTFGL